MRIGLDISSAFARHSGISFYVENLLAGLVEVDKTDEFYLYTAFWSEPRRLEDIPLPKAHNFHIAYKRAPQRLLLPIDELGAGIQERWFRGWGLDIFHGLGHLSPPLKRIPAVVTVHHVGGISDRATPWEKFYLGPLTNRSIRRADKVIAVSEFSREEAIRHWSLPPNRVVAVHEGGPASVFRPLSDEKNSNVPGFGQSESLDAAARIPIGPADSASVAAAPRVPSEPYILHVGSFLEHKNIPTVIRAFHRWLSDDPKRPERLLLIGRPGRESQRIAELVSELKLQDRVRVRPSCPQEELVALYQNAEMVAVPSLLEGFGFPVLEAMACGVPVLSSTAGALPEVAGDAALLLDPGDVEAWTNAMRTIATEPKLADELRRKGLLRAARFNWAGTARGTLDVYRGVLTAKKSGGR